jgi:hypothetical protein
LLLRNAKQILKIVKATFTDSTFVAETSSESIIAQAPTDDGSNLAALWAQAVQRLPKESSMNSEAHASLEALYKVSLVVRL